MQTRKDPIPNKARTAKTRKALIRAARKLFVQKGYGETGTPELAKAADVTRGALYHHFADKQALFRAVIEEEARAVASQIAGMTKESDSAMDALISGAEAYFQAMTVPGRARLLLVDGPAILGISDLDRIDKASSRAELRKGLAMLVTEQNITNDVLDALTLLLSAAFDRAALAIAEGDDITPFKQAITAILEALADR